MARTAILNFDDSQFVAVTQGAEYNESITWSNEDGTPMDLTNYTAKMQVRLSHDEPLILQLSTEDGTIVLSSLGVINFIIPYTTTQCLPGGTFSYDFKLFDPTNIPSMLMRGQFVINEAITI
jgi:hypothetical protein